MQARLFLLLLLYSCLCFSTEITIADVFPSNTGSIWQPLSNYFGAGEYVYSLLGDLSTARIQVDPVSGVLFGRPPPFATSLVIRATDQQGNVKSGRVRVMPQVVPTSVVEMPSAVETGGGVVEVPASFNNPAFGPPSTLSKTGFVSSQALAQAPALASSNNNNILVPVPIARTTPNAVQSSSGTSPLQTPPLQQYSSNSPPPPPQFVPPTYTAPPQQALVGFSQVSSVPTVSSSANVGTSFRLEASLYFKSVLPLSYSMTGAPVESRLAISTQSGTIFGTPGEADANMSPLNLVVGGTDPLGRFATFTLVLLVQRAPPDPNTVIIIESEPFFYDARKLFSAQGATFSASGLPAGSGLTFQQSGMLFGTPNRADIQAVPYTLRISSSNSETVLLRLTTGANPAFSTISQGKAVPTLNLVQGTYFSVNFANFIVGNVTGVLYGVVGLPQGTGMVMDSRSGTFFGTPNSADARALQPLSPSLIVVAPDGSSLSIQFSVSVRAVRSAPVALPIPSQTIRQGMTLNINLASYFSSDDPLLGYAIYGLPAGSGLFLNSQSGLLSGIVTASDVAVSQGSAETGFRVLSACANSAFNSSCSDLVLIVNNTSTNPQPVISRIPDASLFQGVFFSFDLAPFVRTSGSSPAFSVQGLPRGTGMSVDSSTGLFSGIPSNADVQALQPLNLTLYVSDGRTRSQRAWTVHVRWPNRRPVTQVMPVLNATVGVLLQFDASRFFSDPDQDVLSFAISNIIPDSGFSIDSTSGIISGIPTIADANVGQPQRIVLEATDSSGLTAQATLYVSVRKSNSPPRQTGLIPDQAWMQGVPIQLNLSSFFIDPDRDALQYAVSGLPRDTGIVISTFSGQLMGTPTMADLNAMQPLRVLLSVIDGNGGRTVTDFFVTVKRGNRAPIALPIPAAYVTVGRFFSFSGAPFFADEDGEVLVFSMEGLPAGSGMSFNTVTSELSGTPNDIDLQASQPLELLIWASDGKDRSRGRVFLTIRPANRPPYADVIPPGSLTQGSFFSMSFSDYFHDPDNEALTYILEGLPLGSGLSLDSKRGQLSGRPSEADVLASPITLFVTGSDGRNGTARTSLQLRVQKINVPPIVTLITNAQAIEGTPFWKDLGMSFTDPDNDRLTFQLTGLPDGSGLTLNPSSGQMDGVPTAADVTPQTPRAIRVSANDGRGGVTQAQFFLTVRPKTFVPTAQTIPPQKALQGIVFQFLSASYFTNPSRLKFSVTGLPPGTGFSMDQAGVLAGVPSVADRVASPLSLTVVAQEPMGGQASVPLFLVVAQQNRAPVASLIPPATVRVGGDSIQVSMSAFFQDPDGQALTFELQGLNRGTGFSFNRLTGVLAGAATMDDFLVPQPLRIQVIASDGSGGTASVEFIVSVLPPNNPPTVKNSAAPISTVLGQPMFLNVGQWFTDPEDDILIFALNGLVPATGFRIDEDTGLITGSLSMDDCFVVVGGAPLKLNVSASDGVATVYTVINILGCPFRVFLPLAVAQVFAPFTYDGSQGFPKPKQGSLTFSLVNDVNNWISIQANTGILSGRPTQLQCSAGDLPSFFNVTITANAGRDVMYATLQVKVQCAIEPVKATPIPPATAPAGKMFFLDISSRFDYSGPSLKYQITGLPGGTGLALNPSGAITGIPNQADCGMTQPLALKINAQDINGNTASGRFFLTIKCNVLEDIPPSKLVPSNPSKGVSPMPSQSGRSVERVSFGQVLYLDLGSKLMSEINNPTFSLSALPVGTGFCINPLTGVVSGSPTSVDCQQASSSDGPTLFRILAQDATGAQVGMSLFVQVDCSAAQGFGYSNQGDSRRSFAESLPNPIIVRAIPLQVVMSGVLSKVDLRPYFSSNQSLSFIAQGLESGNGLIFSDGVISGTPRCKTDPLAVSIIANNENSDSSIANFSLIILCAKNGTDYAPASVAIPEMYVQAGRLFYFNISEFFAEPNGGSLTFRSSCKASPCGAQISSTGIVTGQISSPIDLVITASSPKGLTVSSELRLRMRDVLVNSSVREQKFIMPLFAKGQQGQRFSFSFANVSLTSKWSSFGIQGLMRGTGLAFDHANGRLWGIPSLIDASVLQPLSLRFVAQSNLETVIGTLLLSVTRAPIQGDSTCEALGWDSLRGKNNSICASSTVNQGQCAEPASFSTASRLCGSWGARLCSAKELSDDEALGTGCGLDTKLVWSNSECAGGFQAIGGSSQSRLSKCVSRTQPDLFGVRCCTVSRFFPPTKNTKPTVSEDIPILNCGPQKACIFDLSVYFADRDGDSLTFIASGLPEGSGFQMGLTTGVLAGVPTQADFSMAGFGNISAILSITADDGRGGWVVTPIQLMFFQQPSTSNLVLKPKALDFTVTRGEVAVFSVASAFSGGRASFSQIGLPMGSGLKLDRASGIISGTPNQLDQSLGLIEVTITATDAKGRADNAVCFVRVLNKQGFQEPSGISSLGSEVAYVGTPFQLDCTPHFGQSGLGWRFAISGLPAESGLSMSSVGLLSGTPNQQDLARNPYVLSVSTSSTNQHLAAKLVLYVLPMQNASSIGTNRSIAINKRLVFNATVGLNVLADLTSAVSNPLNSVLVFQAIGLLPESGLRVMDSGILTGVPNGFDSDRPQPLAIGVIISNSKGDTVTTIINLFVASRSAVQSRGDIAYRAVVEMTNTAPQSQPIPSLTVSVGRWTEFRIQSFFTDPDNDPITLTLAGLPRGSGLALENGALYGTPNQLDLRSSPLRVRVTASDGLGGTSTQTLNIIVNDIISNTVPNRAPVASDMATQFATETKLVRIDTAQAFSDPDMKYGDTLEYSLEGLPWGTGLHIVPSSGVIMGTVSTADMEESQPLFLTVTARDNQGLSAQTFFQLVVTQLNDQPFGIPFDDITVAAGSEVQIDLSQNFYDPNGETLVFKQSGLPSRSGLTLSDEGLLAGRILSADVAQQPLQIVVTASSSRGSASSTLVLAIQQSIGKNRPPTITTTIRTMRRKAGSFVEVPVWSYFMDPDGDELRFEASRFPPGTGLKLTDGVLSGTLSSLDSNPRLQPRVFNITSIDPSGASVTATFPLRIETANTPPLSTSIPTREVLVGHKFNIDVSMNFLDPDLDDVITFKLLDKPSGSDFVIEEPTGIVYGTPSISDYQFAQLQTDGILKLTVVALDALGASSSSTLPLRIKRPSTASCEKLGWDFRGSIPGICSESQKDGKCPLQLTFANAVEACDSMGARLCTVLELEAKVGLKTKCGTDKARVWSADDCKLPKVKGVAIQFANGTKDVICATRQEKSKVLCCADSDQVVQPKPKPSLPGIHIGPILLGNIPPASGIVGSSFVLEVWPYFSGASLNYSQSGLPLSSGLTLLPEIGILTGIPSNVDLGSRSIFVTADDGKGGKIRASLMLDIQPDIPALSGPQSLKLTANVGQPFSSNLASKFAQGSNGYRMSGVPSQSGLSLDSKGMLKGTPTDSDFRASPLTLIITAISPPQSTKQLILELNIVALSTIRVDPIPALLYFLGISIDPTPLLSYFHSSANLPLTIVGSGLPLGSGLAIQDGNLIGRPNSADLISSRGPEGPGMIVRLLASDSQGATANATFHVDISPPDQSAVDIQTSVFTKPLDVGPTFEPDSVSEKTCSQLGWAVQFDYSRTICTESRGTCSPTLNYERAAKQCATKGARLCLQSELALGVAIGNPCENSRIWTSTRCGTENATWVLTRAAGSEQAATELPERCTDLNELLPVQCCADTIRSVPKLALSMRSFGAEKQELKWVNPEVITQGVYLADPA